MLHGADLLLVIRGNRIATSSTLLFIDGVPKVLSGIDASALPEGLPIAELTGPLNLIEDFLMNRRDFRDISHQVSLSNADLGALMILTGILHHP